MERDGVSIDRKDWTSNATEFFVFQLATPYQIALDDKGINYRYINVLSDADVVTVDQSAVKLDTDGITLDQVQFLQGGGMVY